PRPPPATTPFPYTTLFRSLFLEQLLEGLPEKKDSAGWVAELRSEEDARWSSMLAEIESRSDPPNPLRVCHALGERLASNDIVIGDRKSTRLNSSHVKISYA